MNRNEQPILPDGMEGRVRRIVDREDLGAERSDVRQICASLGIDTADCAAALLFMLQQPPSFAPCPLQPAEPVHKPAFRQPVLQTIKMVRYRLEIGHKHQATAEIIKKVLVEESGVDYKNIANVNIHDVFTLIELPDEMPLDIFQHLKSVEINKQKLDIRRIKTRRFKKRNNGRNNSHQRPAAKPQSESA